MNNRIYIFIVIAIAIVIISCNARKPILQKDIEIVQSTTDLPLILRANMVDDKAFRIHFHFSFICTNNTFKDKKINNITYYYSKKYGKKYMSGLGEWGGIGIRVYKVKGDSLHRFKVSDSNILKEMESDMFIVYTGHDINTESTKQQLELMPYLDYMKHLGKNSTNDTLALGTLEKFKERHPELIKTLLEGDSISFRISDIDNKNDTLIVLPLKY